MEARPSIDRLRTISSGLRPQFIPTFAEDDVVFIPNASGETAEVVARREHDGVNIALPASFQPRKNQLDAVRALSMMRDQSARLTLWGAINNANPYVLSVRELIVTLGLRDRVILAGFGTESDVYSTADIVPMTSSSEGFGRPLIEAAYNGLPTVTYDFEFGPRDAIEEGGSGFIVPVGDVGRLAEKLELLVADERLRTRFGRRARELYDERFATEKILERHRRMLGPHKRTSVNLVEAFATDGGEPVSIDDLVHRVRRSSGGPIHHVTVGSRTPVRDVQIDDGMRVRTPKTVRWPGSTRITFRSSQGEVISYTSAVGSVDRRYLANTTSDQRLEVLPWLRRDGVGVAGLSRVTVPTMVWHWWLPGRVHKSYPRIAASARRAPRHVMWKMRQLSKNCRNLT